MDKIVDVKNLRISFRTNNGTVKAVRGIDFELNKGQTLAIVGESGSGKSVTARAMLGILAPNSIVESGEIIYDGKDLLKISEDEMHEYRGNRISMIFQDPMSSLNPIMKIGKQLTEAMLLNGKANQRNAKKEFDSKIKLLEQNVKEAAKQKGIDEKKVTDSFVEFRKMMDSCTKFEKEYDDALGYAKSALKDIEYLIDNLYKMEQRDIKSEVKDITVSCNKCFNEYVIRKDKSNLIVACGKLKAMAEAYLGDKDTDAIKAVLSEMKSEIEAALALEKPHFIAMGYYSLHEDLAKLDHSDVKKMNQLMSAYLKQNFMVEFERLVSEGIRYSDETALKAKEEAIKQLEQKYPVFDKKELSQKECEEAAKELSAVVEASIDRLAIHKDNLAYTFRTSINTAIKTYFRGIPHNEKEEKRVQKDTVKYEKAKEKGKNIGSVIPPVIVDLELAHNNMKRAVSELLEAYRKELKATKEKDYLALADEMVDFLCLQGSKMVYVVTKEMAKAHAIELMEEVGIAEPKKRYNQYPFQFSGGMRQRIVIAIALAANPEILICDEPTTALDVTIQSQILELINRLKVERQLSIIFITHDLGVVANMADRIAVMYAGKIVEIGNVDEIFYEPKHPYTWALLSSMPDLDTKEKLEAIPGTPPNMIHPPVGDAFAARNKYAMQIDFEEQPPFFEVSPTHYAATWLLHPNAPKVDPPKIVTDRIVRMKALGGDQ